MKKYIIILCLFIVAIACSDNCKKTREYYPSGELKGLLSVCNGSEIGEFISYYESGEVNLKGKIKNGHFIGEVYRYRKNGKVGLKQFFDSNNKKVMSYYNDSNEVLFEINAYRLFDNNIHAKKVFLDKKIIDTVESNFVKLKRIKNKLEVELISKNPTYKDSIQVYFAEFKQQLQLLG
jgi:antitoxin component YwqK of YwqJK toxin-antitoxin module